MLPEYPRATTHGLLRPLSGRPAAASGFLRCLIAALVAVGVVVPPAQYAVAWGASLLHQLPGHLPRKQQRVLPVAKTWGSLAASTRSYPRGRARSAAARRLRLALSPASSPGASWGTAGPRSVFRPLRC